MYKEITNIKDMTLYTEDGKEIFTTDKIQDIEVDCWSPNAEVNFRTECSFSMDCDYINTEAIKQLFGIKNTPMSYEIVAEHKTPIYVQARRHKKKRVNKKWLKKYGYRIDGYKIDKIHMDSCSIVSVGDGQFEVTVDGKIR